MIAHGVASREESCGLIAHRLAQRTRRRCNDLLPFTRMVRRAGVQGRRVEAITADCSGSCGSRNQRQSASVPFRAATGGSLPRS